MLNDQKMLNFFRLSLVVSISWLLLPQATQAATFVVNSTADTVDANTSNSICADSNGDCSLRAAVQQANALAGDDTISVPAGSFVFTRSGTDDTAAAGDLDITTNITLNGAGVGTTIIDGDDVDRVFDVTSTGDFTLRNVTVRDGSTDDGGAGIDCSGGAVTILDVVFSSHSSGGNGGAVAANNCDVSLNRTTMQNSTADYGGGVAITVTSGNNGLDISLLNSTVKNNTSTLSGGGMFIDIGSVLDSPAQLAQLTVHENQSTAGGGISMNGDIEATNLTVTENSASFSGGGDFSSR